MSSATTTEETSAVEPPGTTRKSPTGEPPRGSEPERTRIVIVGTGFAGLGAAIRLLQDGHLDFVILERTTEVGGTWRDDTYPGCRCDVPSNLYSFSFAPNPEWSESYSPQPEILAYLRATAERFGVVSHIRWGQDVVDASWDDAEGRWLTTTNAGAFSSQLLILGTGALAEPLIPDIPGIGTFAGKVTHSARWDADYDVSGKRVAVIGTGASAIQIVPAIQPQVASLTVFQRTPAWVVPHPGRPVRSWQRHLFRRLPITQRAVRSLVYLARELMVLAFVKYPKLMKAGEKQARRHLESQVQDPQLRSKLTPHYDMGCKRVLPSNDFYPAVARPNVKLITEDVTSILEHAVVTADAREHPVDAIIFGTGFHVTDNPMARLVHGRNGHQLSEIYDGDIPAYLGTTIPHFPNLIMMTGPNTGLGHSSMVFMIESQLNYICDGLRQLDAAGMDILEVRSEVAAAYNAELQRQLPGTVWGSGCASWYLDKNGRNITLWPGFTFTYHRKTRRLDAADYAFNRAHTSRPTASAVP